MKRILPPFVLALAVAALAQQPSNHNLLQNASFEEGEAGWTFSTSASLGASASDKGEFKAGKSSIRLENSAADECQLSQKVPVRPGMRYRLTGYIKTKDVSVVQTSAHIGATLSLKGGVEKSESFVKTKNWTKATLEFDSGTASEVEVGSRLGGSGSDALGTAWFDDLSLVELGSSDRR